MTVTSSSDEVTGRPESDDQERAGESIPEPLSKNDVFGVLSNQRRRLLLETIIEEGPEPIDLSAATTIVASVEKGVDVDDLEYDERKTVHISIYQHHAPKLDDLGIITYDKRAGTVAVGERFDDVRPYLDVPAMPDESQPATSDGSIGTDRPDEIAEIDADTGDDRRAQAQSWVSYLPLAFVPVAGLLAVGHLEVLGGSNLLWALLTAVAVLALGVAHWTAIRTQKPATD